MSEIKPIAYDLFCGLGGWTEGLLAAGYEVTGYDIEAHEYGDQKYPATLVLRDVMSIHGSEFKDAALIVASPPCQEYSYMAMPFSRGKAIAKALRGEGKFPDGYTGSRTIEQLNALFNACFRIQREASEAAGRHIPMVVENVIGAQPWVGKAKANFGSFYLWGDVEMVGSRVIAGGMQWGGVRAAKLGRKNDVGSWFNIGSPGQTNVNQNPVGRKVPGMNFHDYEKTGKPGRSFQGAAAAGTNQRDSDGVKQAGLSGPAWFDKGAASHSSKSLSRKAASAQIAKIPFALSSYIARAYKPTEE